MLKIKNNKVYEVVWGGGCGGPLVQEKVMIIPNRVCRFQ